MKVIEEFFEKKCYIWGSKTKVFRTCFCKRKILFKNFGKFLYHTEELCSVKDVDYRGIENMCYTHNNGEILVWLQSNSRLKVWGLKK